MSNFITVKSEAITKYHSIENLSNELTKIKAIDTKEQTKIYADLLKKMSDKLGQLK